MSQEQYRQLSLGEREYIRYHRIKHKRSICDVARLIDRHRSTVYRELARNKNSAHGYGAVSAHRMAKDRRHVKPTGIALKNECIQGYVERNLMLGWSPEQIAGRLSMDHPDQTISHESIYLYVYGQAKKGYKALCRCLASKRLKRRARYRSKTQKKGSSDAPVTRKTPISSRPDHINDRSTCGHWEADLVIGTRGASALFVAVERKSRYAIIAPLFDRTADSMRRTMVEALGGLPAHLRSSVTLDNGAENARHKEIEAILKLIVFFCDPYKSWQKGAVENINGLIRRSFPKGTDFRFIDLRDVIALMQALNNRPRKCLGYRMPNEAFAEMIASGP